MRLDDVVEVVRDLVSRQGDLLTSQWISVEPMTHHDHRDFTTQVDLEVEENIKVELRRRYPGQGLSGEETRGENRESEYQWLIDPIDGTKYYAGQSSLFAVSVGLLHRDEPVLGVVYAAASRQCFHAYRGGGAFLDERRLEGSSVKDLNEVIVNVDTPSSHALPEPQRQWLEQRLVALTGSVYRVRALGIGSLAACWLASGALDAYIDLTGYSKPQDLAAGRIIMQEAGARVEYVDPGVGPPRLVAAPPAVWEALKRLLVD